MDTQIKDYQQTVADILSSDYFPEADGYTVRTDTVRKNNNVNLHSINVLRKDSNVAPTFYLDDYLKDGFEPEATAQSISDTYQKVQEEQKSLESNDFQKLYNFEAIKDTICFKVISRQRNADMANNCPTININDDLMIAFYLQISREATCLINNNMCEIWELKEPQKELYKFANDNTERLHPISFQSLFDVMKKMMPLELDDDFTNDTSTPMYVLTNEDKINGASVMFYHNGTVLDNCIKEIKSQYDSIQGVYILPSSVHETLIIPDMQSLDIDENALVSMVREVNQTNVSASDFLSDNIFYYRTGEPIKQLTYSAPQIVR